MSQIVRELIDKRLEDMFSFDNDMVVIYYKGRHLRMPSGKSAWKNKGDARLALNSALRRQNLRWAARESGHTGKIDIGEHIKQLEAEGVIEFKFIK